MSNIEYINLSSDQSGNEDLPWLKQWSKNVCDHGTPHEIITVMIGDKGMLLLTGVHKSFVFKREKLFRYLLEALTFWVSEKSECSPLIITTTPKGRLDIGLHHEKPKVFWRSIENGFESIRLEETLVAPMANPFLTQPDNPARRNPGHEGTSTGRTKKDKMRPPEEPAHPLTP